MNDDIKSLQSSVSDHSVPVTTLLRQSLVLAHSVGDHDAQRWLRLEVNGYSTKDEQVGYRHLKGGYIVLTAEGRRVPIVWRESQTEMNSRFITLSIPELESLMEGEAEGYAVTIQIDHHTVRSLKLEPGDRVAFDMSRTTLVGLLHAVRQRILDWTLSLRADMTSNDTRSSVLIEEGDRRMDIDSQSVFVVHGRNHAAREALFTFLRSIGLHPLEWSEIVAATGQTSPYIGEVLKTGFSMAQAVVVLMTPDDEARLRGPYQQPDEPHHETDLTPQPRQNVLFEAGMAMGLCPDRTILVELGKLRPISDVSGRHAIRLDDSMGMRHELAQRLQTAGCTVNLKGIDWHSAGHFLDALAITEREQRQVTQPGLR